MFDNPNIPIDNDLLILFFEGHKLILQGQTSVNQNFGTWELDSENKRKIGRVLNDEFCNLGVKADSQSNYCTTETVNFVVI